MALRAGLTINCVHIRVITCGGDMVDQLLEFRRNICLFPSLIVQYQTVMQGKASDNKMEM